MEAMAQSKDNTDVGASVARLMAAYAHAIDDDRLEEWPEFFTEDGVYRVTTRENADLELPASLIFCEGKGMLQDRISALRNANIFEPHVYCHMVGLPEILESKDGEHRVRNNFTVVRTMAEGDMSVFACGRFFDRIVEVSGVLRFRERVVILDSRRIDTLLVIPFCILGDGASRIKESFEDVFVNDDLWISRILSTLPCDEAPPSVLAHFHFQTTCERVIVVFVSFGIDYQTTVPLRKSGLFYCLLDEVGWDVIEGSIIEGVKAGVEALFGEQCLVGTGLDNATFVEDNNAISPPDCCKAMGNYDGGTTFQKL